LFVLQLVVILIVPGAEAQNNNNDYRFRVYTQEEGLASGSLRGIAAGNTGFLWFFSRNGLSRFDGHNFKIFSPDPKNPGSISSYTTRSMLVDGNDNKLFRTDNSISKFISDSGIFRKLVRYYDDDEVLNFCSAARGAWVFEKEKVIFIDSRNEVIRETRLPSGFQAGNRSVSGETGGRFWMASDTLIYALTAGSKNYIRARIISYDSNETSRAAPLLFFTDKQGTPCFFSLSGLYRFDPARSGFIRYADLRLRWSAKNPVRKIFIHKQNHILVALSQDSLIVVDANTGMIKPFKVDPASGSPVLIFDVISSADSSVWISTTNRGVFRIYPRTGKREHIFHDINNRNSLVSDNIEYLFESQHILWMTSPGLGVIKAESNRTLMEKFQPAPRTTGDPAVNQVRALAELNTRMLLVGTMKGLFVFDKTSKKFSLANDPSSGKPLLKDSAVTSIVKDKSGNFYFACLRLPQIVRVNFEKGEVLRFFPGPADQPSSTTIRCLFIDSKNNLWTGTEDNVLFRTPLSPLSGRNNPANGSERFAGRINSKDTLIFNSVFTFYETPDHRLFIGTQDGLYSYQYAGNSFKGFFNTIPDEKSLRSRNVRSIFEDANRNLWIGTAGGGLNRSDTGLGYVETFSTEKGRLSDNFVFTILTDDRGYLWLTTNRGICRFDPVKGYYRNFSLRDGIQNNEFTTNAAIRMSTGELAMGGIDGFNLFHPDSIGENTDTPKVLLSEFKVNDVTHPIAGKIKLAYNENDLSFEFAALSYYRSRENQYAYWLEGFQPDWVYLRNRRYVNFINLPPGHYTMHVKGCDYSGLWNEKGFAITLHIAKPFWETAWFRALLVLALFSVIYFIVRYRLLQRLKIERLRSTIARDLHDEIGSNLSGIALFSRIAAVKLQSAPVQVPGLLNKISSFTQASEDAINDIIWMINSGNDTFEKIAVRMRKVSGEILESAGMELHFNYDEKLNESTMNMENRKQFYLLFKEALNNAVKYSGGKNLTIDLLGRNHAVYLRVADDGRGFDTANTDSGNGLKNMRLRAEVLGGKLRIDSIPGRGTSIELEFSK